jgi:hypothetical protein
VKTLRSFIGWVADHPVRFISWLLISCTSGGFLAFYDIPWPWCLGFMAVIATACYLDVATQGGKILLGLLCLSLALPVKADEDSHFEPAGMAGVAVVVVVAGGICVYLLVRTCQRVFPKTPAPSTNEPPNFGGISGGTDSAGSWCYYAPVSCYIPQSEQQWPQVTMELSGVIEENEHGPFFHLTASRRMSHEEDSQDFDAFQTDLARHGIAMGPVGSMFFGRNGKPAYEQETPIRFSESNGEHITTLNSDTAPSVLLVVQRSFDLKAWSDFGFVSVPVGQQFKLIDTTTRQSAFYRIQPR